ncbi:MauE/DoxX family redox-associated membrane protein [Paenibacillus sp. M1]|uniref:MauE/DoxX family redox-associated membrane protein n=1 Tax=Paenibacillus haidiansis TaxID=1574488 RepID=A0ABU7VWQ0_9BACL
MDWVVFIQLFVSVLFLVSAASKLSKPSSFMNTLRQLRIPPFRARRAAVIIPLAELAACGLLLFPATLVYGAAFGLLLLSSYVWAVWRAKGRMVSYEWFGGLLSEKFGSGLYIRHAVLFGMMIYLLAAPAFHAPKLASFTEISSMVLSSLGIMILYALVLTLWQYHKLYRE